LRARPGLQRLAERHRSLGGPAQRLDLPVDDRRRAPRLPARTVDGDFDLYLDKLSGSRWTQVAQATGSTSDEDVTYNGTAGTYRWRVVSYAGSGAYTFGLAKPS
jgi:hypothetical protein